MRHSFVKPCTFGFLVSLSLVALAATVHAAAPPSGGYAGNGGNGGNGGKAKGRKAVSCPSQAAPAIPTASTRRGPLIDPDGR